MYCANCGQQIPDKAVFCPLCGGRADGSDRAPAPEPAVRFDAPAAPAKPKKKGKTGLIIGIVAAVVVVALVVGGLLVVNDMKEKYAVADGLFDDGEYADAKAVFEKIAVYKDSGARAKEAGYRVAEAFMEEEAYLDAQAAFLDLGNYEDSAEQADVAGKLDVCANAEALIDGKKFEDALALLTPIAGFAQADALTADANDGIAYRDAAALMAAGDYTAAKTAFEAIGAYADAPAQAKECGYHLDYDSAKSLLAAGDMQGAADLLSPLADAGFSDAAEQYALCLNYIAYDEAKAAYDAGKFYTAMTGFQAVGDFQDAAALAASCVRSAPAAGAVYRNSAFADSGTSLRVYNSDSRATYIKFYIDDTLVATMYVPGNSNAKINLCKGTYSMKQAYGTAWYGTEEMFGPDGTYLANNFNGGQATYPLTSNAGYEMRDNSTNGNMGQDRVSWGDF